MRWQRWLLVSMMAVSLAVGCGNGDEPDLDNQTQNDTNQPSDNDGNDNDDNGNEGDDDFSAGLDVWVGSQTLNEDNPTELVVGQRFGGRFTSDGTHFFSIDLDAGDILAVSSLDFEDELQDSLQELRVSITRPADEDSSQTFSPRRFVPEEHDEREFFAAVDGSYELAVSAPGGDDEAVGFSFETERRTVDASGELALPASTDEEPALTDGQDLDDARIDAFEVSVEQLQSVDAEIFATRAPSASALESRVYVYDADADRLVADASSQSDEIVDPRIVFDLDADTKYWLVVDMVENHGDAAYEIHTEFIATSPTNPQVLSVEATSQFSATIKERSVDPYFDYFEVSVGPGEYKRVVVSGDDQLEPVMDLETVGDQTASAPSFALPVDDVAAATLGGGSDQGTATFAIAVTDQRNLMGQLDTYYGGDGFGYTITVEDAAPSTTAMSSGISQTVALSSPGDLEILEISVADGHLLWLDSGLDVDLGQVLSPNEIPYLPVWATTGETTLSSTHQLDAYIWGQGQTMQFWLRDDFFRGGAADHQTDARLTTYDMEAQSYLNAALDSDNDSPADANLASPPTKILGAFMDAQPTQPGSHYFEFSASIGDHVVVASVNDEDMRTELSLKDPGGIIVGEGAQLVEQHRGSGYVDTALVYEVESSGTHQLNVEQHCQAFSDCDTGDVEIRLVVD